MVNSFKYCTVTSSLLSMFYCLLYWNVVRNNESYNNMLYCLILQYNLKFFVCKLDEYYTDYSIFEDELILKQLLYSKFSAQKTQRSISALHVYRERSQIPTL